MNVIEINQISDLNIILEDNIVITHDPTLQEKEISSNMWCVSLSENFSRKLAELDIVKFVQQLIDLRQEQIDQNIIQPPILFYLWFDELAFQLRFNFISGCPYQLPFGCSVKYLDSPDKIINRFITTTWPDKETNMADVAENEKDYMVEVFRKCIQKVYKFSINKMINHKNFLLKDIDLKNGIVTYNDFDINLGISFEEQIWSFKEDILQMEFVDGKYVIDIGWYPEFDPKGNFTIEVIENFDWSNPIFIKKCQSIDLLKMYLQEAIDFVFNKN